MAMAVWEGLFWTRKWALLVHHQLPAECGTRFFIGITVGGRSHLSLQQCSLACTGLWQETDSLRVTQSTLRLLHSFVISCFVFCSCCCCCGCGCWGHPCYFGGKEASTKLFWTHDGLRFLRLIAPSRHETKVSPSCLADLKALAHFRWVRPIPWTVKQPGSQWAAFRAASQLSCSFDWADLSGFTWAVVRAFYLGPWLCILQSAWLYSLSMISCIRNVIIKV